MGGSVSGSLLFILVSGEADPAVQCTTLLTAAGHSQTPLVTVFVVVVWGGGVVVGICAILKLERLC